MLNVYSRETFNYRIVCSSFKLLVTGNCYAHRRNLSDMIYLAVDALSNASRSYCGNANPNKGLAGLASTVVIAFHCAAVILAMWSIHFSLQATKALLFRSSILIPNTRCNCKHRIIHKSLNCTQFQVFRHYSSRAIVHNILYETIKKEKLQHYCLPNWLNTKFKIFRCRVRKGKHSMRLAAELILFTLIYKKFTAYYSFIIAVFKS